MTEYDWHDDLPDSPRRGRRLAAFIEQIMKERYILACEVAMGRHDTVENILDEVSKEATHDEWLKGYESFFGRLGAP